MPSEKTPGGSKREDPTAGLIIVRTGSFRQRVYETLLTNRNFQERVHISRGSQVGPNKDSDQDTHYFSSPNEDDATMLGFITSNKLLEDMHYESEAGRVFSDYEIIEALNEIYRLLPKPKKPRP